MADVNSSTAVLTLQDHNKHDDTITTSDGNITKTTTVEQPKRINWVKLIALGVACTAWFSTVGFVGYYLGHPDKYD